MDTIGLLFYMGGFLIGICAAVTLHELGHLVFGRLSGYRFVSFRLLKWLWTRDAQGKLQLTTSPGLGGMMGQCLMAPCEEEAQFRFVLYNAGGGLANLFAGAPLLTLFFLVKQDAARMFLFGLGFANLLLGVMNLLPRKKAPLPSDGTNIREAKKSAEAAHGLYLTLKTNAEMTRGKRIAAYAEDTFAVSDSADTVNFLVANTVLLRASQLEDGGRFGESYAALLRLEPARLPSFYGGQAILSLMFHELVYFDDAASAARARGRIDKKAKDKLFQKLLTMKHSVFLPYQAAKAAFLDGEADQARELIAQAKKLASSLQNPGQEHSVALMLDRLEAKMGGQSKHA